MTNDREGDLKHPTVFGNILSMIAIGGRTNRRTYLIAGLLCFTVKYALDHLVAALVFNRSWLPTAYLRPSSYYSVWAIPREQWSFFFALIALSLPFMAIGLILTIRRLRDADLPLWLAMLFFVPSVNLVFFVCMVSWPTRDDTRIKDGMPASDERALTAARKERRILAAAAIAAAIAVAGSAVLSGLIAVLSTMVLGTYGWGLFIGLPVFLGWFPTMIYGRTDPDLNYSTCLSLGALSMALLGFAFLAGGMEGIICLMMALPVALPLMAFGAFIGYAQVRHGGDAGRFSNSLNSVALLAMPAIIMTETRLQPAPPEQSIVSSVRICAPTKTVWKNVVAFSQLPPPTEWIFKTGIAYPIKAELVGTGPGAIRRCVFSTGAFVEPITVWDEPHLLRFSVTDQPEPMRELSPFPDLHPPHLDGFLRSEQGQFRLIPQSDGSTLLEGTTWYRNRMWPQGYWSLWSDWIIHKIHLRVLDHIKLLAESQADVGTDSRNQE